MNKVKAFSEYLVKGIARKVPIDKNRAKNFLVKAERKKLSIKERIAKIGINENNAEDYIESCYDIMMLLIRSEMLQNGLKASGNGAHEAEVSYLSILGFHENEIEFADELRYLRNGILYYGTALNKEYALKVLDFIDKIYPRLRKIT